MTEFTNAIYFISALLICAAIWDVFNRIIFPKLILKSMKEIDRNPKWVTSRLHKYYGFHDVDIVLCESRWNNTLPYFRVGKNNKLELWIDSDTPVDDIEDIGRLALAGKIHVKHNVWIDDKPVQWMSVLCYMLDGGDVNMQPSPTEEDRNKKPLD